MTPVVALSVLDQSPIFINPQDAAAVLAGYREWFRPAFVLTEPRASVAVRVLCPDTDEEAQRLAAAFGLSQGTAADDRAATGGP